MSARALLVVLGLCASCDPVTEALVLDVIDIDEDCEPAVFAEVNAISVQAVASDGRCVLRDECVPTTRGTVTGIDTFEQVMRSAGSEEPLIDELELDQADQIAVKARASGCFPDLDDPEANPPILCAAANLDARSDGVLTLELEPQGCIDALELCDP